MSDKPTDADRVKARALVAHWRHGNYFVAQFSDEAMDGSPCVNELVDALVAALAAPAAERAPLEAEIARLRKERDEHLWTARARKNQLDAAEEQLAQGQDADVAVQAEHDRDYWKQLAFKLHDEREGPVLKSEWQELQARCAELERERDEAREECTRLAVVLEEKERPVLKSEWETLQAQLTDATKERDSLRSQRANMYTVEARNLSALAERDAQLTEARGMMTVLRLQLGDACDILRETDDTETAEACEQVLLDTATAAQAHDREIAREARVAMREEAKQESTQCVAQGTIERRRSWHEIELAIDALPDDPHRNQDK